MSNILPSIGRKVWFYEALADAGCLDQYQPYDATIVYVHSPSIVNLRVTKHSGDTIIRTSVPLRNPAGAGVDLHGSGNPYCTWMPYQMGQAAKTEAAEAKLAEAPAPAPTSPT